MVTENRGDRVGIRLSAAVGRVETWDRELAPAVGALNPEGAVNFLRRILMPSLPPILILDDEADDVFILKRLLTKAGVQNAVVSFEDPTAAVAYIDSENKKPTSLYLPCMIFTDLQMPAMNGIEFVRWVRAQPNLEKLPVIMITSSEEPKDREAALAAGVTRFLPKYPTSGGLKTLAAEHRCHIAVG